YKNGSDTLSKAIYLPRSLHVTAQSKQADQQYPDNSLTLRRASKAATLQAGSSGNVCGDIGSDKV
ncbi:hypothetical protein, partial [Enterobacter hormaechei]|uniref:hypothetical protein n=1 Tax=Enterobacter hormaechei TaxID=158836 RepID=UPI003DA74488